MGAWIALALLTAFWIMLQLVPLPPTLWEQLPGRAVYSPEAAAVGIVQPWRPISLSPMSTWLSLVGMSVPIGLLLGWGQFDRSQLHAGRWVLVALITISIFLGLAQVSGGVTGGLYPFDNSSRGFPTGLFANRNHQSAALAMLFPLLGAVIVEARIEGRRLPQTVAVTCLAACLVLPLLLVNGSRAGLALTAVAIVLTFFMVATYPLPRQKPLSWNRRLSVIGAVLIPFMVAGLAFLLGRAASIERLTRLRIEDDQRYLQVATVLEMIQAHFPVGAGYGSFPHVFRVYEPFTSLKHSYFNHAHNDLIEFVFEGGLPSAILALMAAVLFVRQAWRVWRSPPRDHITLYARTATIMITVLILASASDYPLRTPTILVFAIVALAWLSAGAAPLKNDQQPL